MSYLKLPRTWALFACFFAVSVALWMVPEIDIEVSRLFFQHASNWASPFWATLFQRGIGYFLGISLTAVFGVYLYNRCAKRNVLGIDGKRAVYPFLVLIIGAGLIVNVVLKDNFGRARPRDVAEFGGSKQFTPAFVLSQECDRNCSFSSGDAAAAFYSLSLAFVLSRRRRAFLAACAFGVVVSYFRVASGAHFFSDVVVSFFIMWISADLVYHYMLLAKTKSEGFLTVGETSEPSSLDRNWVPSSPSISSVLWSPPSTRRQPSKTG